MKKTKAKTKPKQTYQNIRLLKSTVDNLAFIKRRLNVKSYEQTISYLITRYTYRR